MILELILLLLLMPLGRGAGGGFGNTYSGFCSPTIGIIFGILLGVNLLWLPLFAVAGWLSEKPDPASDVLGTITDGFNVGKEWSELFKRGAIGAVPYLFLTAWIDTYWLLSFIFAWPLAVYIGKHLPELEFPYPTDTWEWSEALRYILAGVPLLFI